MYSKGIIGDIFQNPNNNLKKRIINMIDTTNIFASCTIPNLIDHQKYICSINKINYFLTYFISKRLKNYTSLALFSSKLWRGLVSVLNQKRFNKMSITNFLNLVNYIDKLVRDISDSVININAMKNISIFAYTSQFLWSDHKLPLNVLKSIEIFILVILMKFMRVFLRINSNINVRNDSEILAYTSSIKSTNNRIVNQLIMIMINRLLTTLIRGKINDKIVYRKGNKTNGIVYNRTNEIYQGKAK